MTIDLISILYIKIMIFISLVLTCRKNRGFFIYRRPSGMRFPNRNYSDSSDHIGDSLGHCFYHVTLVVKIPGARGPENPRFLRFLRQVRTRFYKGYIQTASRGSFLKPFVKLAARVLPCRSKTTRAASSWF